MTLATSRLVFHKVPLDGVLLTLMHCVRLVGIPLVPHLIEHGMTFLLTTETLLNLHSRVQPNIK